MLIKYATLALLVSVLGKSPARAGEIAGTVIANAMMETPSFMRDLQAARAELRQVLDLSAEPDAVGSVTPK